LQNGKEDTTRGSWGRKTHHPSIGHVDLASRVQREGKTMSFLFLNFAGPRIL